MPPAMPPATASRSSEHTASHQNTHADQTSDPTDLEAAASHSLREELDAANEAFREQEKFIRNLDREATHHEKIIWQQQRELVRLQKVEVQQQQELARLQKVEIQQQEELVQVQNVKAEQQQELEQLRQQRREVPHTAAADLAGVLSTANSIMSQEVHALREHNAYLEARGIWLEREHAATSSMLANTYPQHAQLHHANIALGQELSRKDQVIGFLNGQIEALRSALRHVGS